MLKKLKKVASSYRALPDKKRYAEFITAILSIPVLITVLLSNLNTLKAKDEVKEEKEPKENNVIISYIPQQTETSVVEKDEAPCKQGIGDIEITSPAEGAKLDDDQVTVAISPDSSYCAVVWSYRINDGKWSEFDDKSIALYNLKNGETRFDLRVKSLTNKEEKTLSRRFTYNGGIEPTATPTPTPTPSAL